MITCFLVMEVKRRLQSGHRLAFSAQCEMQVKQKACSHELSSPRTPMASMQMAQSTLASDAAACTPSALPLVLELVLVSSAAFSFCLPASAACADVQTSSSSEDLLRFLARLRVVACWRASQ